MNKIIKQEYKLLGLSILIGFLFYGIYTIPHVSTDGYWWLQGASLVEPWSFLKQSGRFAYDFMLIIFNTLNIYPIFHQPIFMSICIIIMSLLAFFTYCFILSSCKRVDGKLKVLLFMAVLSMYFNTFFTDWFAWAESVIFIHIPALIFAILSALTLNMIKRKYRFIVSAILLIICFGFYQAVGFYFFLIQTIFILKDYLNSTNWKKSLVMIIESFVVFVIATASQLLLSSLLHLERANYVSTDIGKNIENIIRVMPTLFIKNLNTMPSYVFIIVLVITVVFNIFIIRNRVRLGLLVSTLFIGLISILIGPHIIGNEFWLVARTITGFMALPGWLLVMGIMIYSSDYEEDVPPTIGVFLTMLFGIYLIINCYKIYEIGVGLHITNFGEKKSVQYFYNKINEYEEINNTDVTKIGFCRDQNYTYSYEGIVAYGDTNMRGYANEWNRLNMFNYYTGENFKEVQVTEEVYTRHFEGKDWNTLDNKQIVIIGDTAYICLY